MLPNAFMNFESGHLNNCQMKIESAGLHQDKTTFKNQDKDIIVHHDVVIRKTKFKTDLLQSILTPSQFSHRMIFFSVSLCNLIGIFL